MTITRGFRVPISFPVRLDALCKTHDLTQYRALESMLEIAESVYGQKVLASLQPLIAPEVKS
jgi:hypothetical protein